MLTESFPHFLSFCQNNFTHLHLCFHLHLLPQPIIIAFDTVLFATGSIFRHRCQASARIMIIGNEQLTSDSSCDDYSPVANHSNVAIAKTNESVSDKMPPNSSFRRRSGSHSSPRRRHPPEHKKRPHSKNRPIQTMDKNKRKTTKTTPKAWTAGKMWIRVASPVNDESSKPHGRRALTPYQGIRLDAPNHSHSSLSSSLLRTTTLQSQEQIKFMPSPSFQHKPPIISFGESGRLLKPIVGASCYLPQPRLRSFLVKTNCGLSMRLQNSHG